MRHTTLRHRVRLRLLAIAIVAAGCSGCNSVISVYPLCERGDDPCVVQDPRLVGTWKQKPDGPQGDAAVVVVEETPEKKYKLSWKSVTKDRPVSPNLRLTLIKLGSALYLDVEGERVLRLDRVQDYEPLAISGHYILRCSFDREQLVLRALDKERIQKRAAENRPELPFLIGDGDNLVLTVPTKQLQALVQDAELFSEKAMVLVKQ